LLADLSLVISSFFRFEALFIAQRLIFLEQFFIEFRFVAVHAEVEQADSAGTLSCP
jgi:hypothetical protein